MGEEKKSEILGQRLDADELEQVSGGAYYDENEGKACPNKGNLGGCSGAYYVQSCYATVEAWSDCWRTDWKIWRYTPSNEAIDRFGLDRCFDAYL